MSPLKHLLRLACAAPFGLLAACTTAPALAPLPTVPAVDLARYQGRWYEISALPNRFQAQCVADTQADYQLDGDHVTVRNSCRNARGEVEQAQGLAEPVSGSQQAKLRVSFFRPFYGDYWVLALDADYRWVLVGEPTRRYGWVLSRTPSLPPADLAQALGRAEQLGYERQAFVMTPQSAASAAAATR
jgi:apolipoprotein D and lipocalin family protein